MMLNRAYQARNACAKVSHGFVTSGRGHSDGGRGHRVVGCSCLPVLLLKGCVPRFVAVNAKTAILVKGCNGSTNYGSTATIWKNHHFSEKNILAASRPFSMFFVAKKPLTLWDMAGCESKMDGLIQKQAKVAHYCQILQSTLLKNCFTYSKDDFHWPIFILIKGRDRISTLNCRIHVYTLEY